MNESIILYIRLYNRIGRKKSFWGTGQTTLEILWRKLSNKCEHCLSHLLKAYFQYQLFVLWYNDILINILSTYIALNWIAMPFQYVCPIFLYEPRIIINASLLKPVSILAFRSLFDEAFYQYWMNITNIKRNIIILKIIWNQDNSIIQIVNQLVAESCVSMSRGVEHELGWVQNKIFYCRGFSYIWYWWHSDIYWYRCG